MALLNEKIKSLKSRVINYIKKPKIKILVNLILLFFLMILSILNNISVLFFIIFLFSILMAEVRFLMNNFKNIKGKRRRTFIIILLIIILLIAIIGLYISIRCNPNQIDNMRNIF
ncbi:hypothetical protein [Clostridium baratii]|uniref:hypothetical protein n=1 Tax=Clostridium baratii TaxID=1561 RepID=UPI003D332E32